MAETVPGFLRLALELRLQIYTIALDQRLGYDPQCYIAISAVSKQIRREVLGIYFEVRKYFGSLNYFANWTARGPPHLLPLVSNISLHVFRDSLLPIANSPRKSLSELDSNVVSEKNGDYWEGEYARRAPVIEVAEPSRSCMRNLLGHLSISKQRLRKHDTPNAIPSLWNSFTAISEIRKIWLSLKDAGYGNGSSQTFNIEQQLLLDMMGAAFKHLEELTVFSNLVSLEYIKNFHDLRTLRFTGYSTSTPEETSQILSSLKNLDTLIIYRYPEHHDKDYSITTSDLSNFLCLTPKVIDTLNPLRSFQVSHMASNFPSQHITIPVIEALGAHFNSLRSLNLSCDVPLDIAVIQSIIKFTASSRLRDIDLRLNSRHLIASLELNAIFPSHIKHGEASLSQDPNGRLAPYLRVSSSRCCLANAKWESICICTQKIIKYIPIADTYSTSGNNFFFPSAPPIMQQ